MIKAIKVTHIMSRSVILHVMVSPVRLLIVIVLARFPGHWDVSFQT